MIAGALRPLLAALGMLAAASAAAAAAGPLPLIDIELVADGSTVFAGEGGVFTEFPFAPSMDGDAIVFVGRRADGRIGIHRSVRGRMSTVVDSSTAIPAGQGRFTGFGGAPVAVGGVTAFSGLGADGQQGIYLAEAGQVRRIADLTTVMPGSDLRFAYLKRPAFDGQQLVFMGRASDKGRADAESPYQGSYRYDLRSQRLDAVASWLQSVPGGDQRFGRMDDTSTAGGRSLITAYSTDGRPGIWSGEGERLVALLDTGSAVPGRAGETFLGFNDAAFERSFETGNFAFRLAVDGKAQSGVYARVDGQLQKVIDVDAEFSGGAENFSGFRAPAMHGDRVFFIGESPSGRQAIYAWRKGKRFPVISRDIELGGRKPKAFKLNQEAAGPEGVAFHATFEDGATAIYYARLREKPGRVVLFDALHGRSRGQVQGGQFVEGGGWTVLNDHDRIVWKLPPMPPDGMLEVDVRNFDPRSQLTADKNIFLGLWGTLFQNHERMGLPDTDNWEFRVGTAHPQFKVEYHARGFGKAAEWVPFDGPFDPSHTYRIRVEWQDGRVRTSVDERVLYFEGFTHEAVDRFNYLHLGTSSHFAGKATRGPVYSNVRLIAFDD